MCELACKTRRTEGNASQEERRAGQKERAPTLAALFPAIREAMEIAGSFELTATGTSMEPFLRGRRDRVELVPPGTWPVRCGDIALCARDSGAFVLHRVYAVDADGNLAIVGDAQFFCERIRKDQMRALVSRCVRNGRTIDCKRSILRAHMTARMCIRVRFPRAMRILARGIYFARRMCTDPAAAVCSARRYVNSHRRKRHIVR